MSRNVMRIVAVLFAVVVLLGGGLYVESGIAQADTQHTATTHETVQHSPSVGAISVFVYATHVHVRDSLNGACITFPSTSCSILDTISQVTVGGVCQLQGQTITDLGITNNWWSDVIAPDGTEGWVSNIYIRGGQTISGEPFCQ